MRSLKFHVFGLLLPALVACQPTQPQMVGPTPLPQDGFIQVYTNQDPSARYTEPYRQQTRPGHNLEQIIIETIRSARFQIDVAVQEFRLPGIAQALAERRQAGIPVRVILENTYSRPLSRFTAQEVGQLPERERSRHREFLSLADQNGDDELTTQEIQQGDALVILDQARVPRKDDRGDGSAGSGLMHHKFLVVDGQTVIVTSANWTTSDVHGDFKSPSSRGNTNNLLKIDSREVAHLFSQEFNLMWGDGPGGKPNSRFGVQKPYRPPQSVVLGNTRITVQFSPTSRSKPWQTSTNGLIGRVLQQARQEVNLALFVFSDQKLVDVLEPLGQRQIGIRALIDSGFMYRSYSEGLDLLGVSLLPDHCQLEPGNRPWQKPINTVGVPRLPPGDLLHHKFALIDGQTVITGSHNWTEAANHGNDETLLVVESALVAAHFQREFDRLYGSAILGLPPAIRRRVETQQKQCANRRPPTPVAQAANPQKPIAKAAPKLAKAAPTGMVNLNTATQAELERLPGVGPGLAKRIVAARHQKPFRSLADLDQVAGVGPKLLERLRDRVSW